MSSEVAAKNEGENGQVLQGQGIDSGPDIKTKVDEKDIDIDRLVSESEDLMVKMKVERENIKNLLQSATNLEDPLSKRIQSENNNETDSALIKKVDGLNISTESDSDKNESAVIITNENASLRSILTYESDDSSNSGSSSASSADNSDDSEDSEEDSEDSDDDDDDEDPESDSSSDSGEDFISETQGAIKKTDKTKAKDDRSQVLAELGLDELPPVPDFSTLSLNPGKDEYFHMGHVRAIIDRIVTVDAIPNIPAYDLDTPLFYGEEKRPLGLVFDLIGQVTAPTYAVRFNSQKDISDGNIEKGMRVYSAPKSNLTNYVFVKELLKMKGSDASWIGDLEAPDDMQEFSDDDDERFTKSGKSRLETQSRKRQHCSQERHKRFERTMNQCNTLNTRVHRLIDARNTVMRSGQIPTNNRTDWNSSFEINNPNAVVFDPSTPPPNFNQPRFYEYACYGGGGSTPKQPHLSGTHPHEVPFMPNVEFNPWTVNIPNNRQANWAAPSASRRNIFYPYMPQSANSAGDSAKDNWQTGSGGPMEQNSQWAANIPNNAQYGAWVDLPSVPSFLLPNNSSDVQGVWGSSQGGVPPTSTTPNIPQGNWSSNALNPFPQNDPSLYKNS